MRLSASMLVAASAALFAIPASGANRGIPHLLGDKDTTALIGTGDVDTFVTSLPKGAALTATVKAAKGTTLLPAISLVRPDGTDVDLAELTAAKYKPGKSSAKVSNFPVDTTGTWAIRVSEFTAQGGGAYTLTTKVRYPKPIKVKGAILPADSFLDVPVPLATGVKLAFTLKRKSGGGGFFPATLREFSGASLNFPPDLFTVTEKGIVLKAVAVTTPSFSDHVLRVPGPGTGVDAVVDYVVKTTWPKRKGVARILSSDEPAITGVTPDEGNQGTALKVTGFNFVSGATIEVGNKPATGVNRNPAGTQLTGQAPSGSGLADVVVTNPDGQEARATGAFLYVFPPTVQSIDVDFGPSTGGTAVVIKGIGYRAGDTVKFGGIPIYGTIDIQDSSTIALVTESHPAGTFLVTVEDPAGVSGASAVTFTFDRRLIRQPSSLQGPVGELRPMAATLGDVDQDLPWDDDLILSSVETEPDGSGGYLPATRILRGNNFLGFDPITAYTFPKPFCTNITAVEAGTGFNLGPSADDYGVAQASVMGDLDGDGDQDLVLGFDGHFIPANYIIFHNPHFPGSSTFPFIRSQDYFPPQAYYYIQYPGTRVLLNNGNDSFVNTTMKWNTTYDYLDMSMPVLSQGIINGETFQARALTLGDLDNDGDLDLILSSKYPVYGTTLDITSTDYTATHFVLPALRMLSNYGDGRFDFDYDIFIANFVPPSGGAANREWFQSVAMAVGDVDANGYQDIVAVNDVAPLTAGGAKLYATRLLRNIGNGIWAAPERLPTASNVDDGRANCVLLEDVTGDGNLDIVIATPDPLVYFDAGSGVTTVKSSTRVLRNQGNGTFLDVTGTAIPAPVGNETWRAHSIALGDLNEDDKPDLVLTIDEPTPDGSGGYLPSTRVLFGDGSGVFTAAPPVFTPPVDLDGSETETPSFLQGSHVLLGDLDSDGDLDLILASRNPAYGIPETAPRAAGAEVIENH